MMAAPQNPSGGSLFGSSAPTAASPAASGQGPFGSGSGAGSSLFGSSQPASGGLFGSSSATTSAGGGLFGKPAEAVKELDPKCFYTPLEELTDQERAAFQCAEFELGCVPTRPPPKDLCF